MNYISSFFFRVDILPAEDKFWPKCFHSNRTTLKIKNVFHINLLKKRKIMKSLWGPGFILCGLLLRVPCFIIIAVCWATFTLLVTNMSPNMASVRNPTGMVKQTEKNKKKNLWMYAAVQQIPERLVALSVSTEQFWSIEHLSRYFCRLSIG